MRMIRYFTNRFFAVFLLILLVFTSCKKWLDISSNTEVVSQDQFNDVSGFRDAVVGVYVKMAKPELYAQEATWRTVEFLAQQYAEVAGADDLNVPRYQWDEGILPNKRITIWSGAYNAIANANQILHFHDKNRHVFQSWPITDSLVRGEMLALRAFLHFDIMRLYGKGNLANRPELMETLTIPYVTEFTKYPTAQRTYRETLDLMKKDVEEAIDYLQADPLSRRNPSSHFSGVTASGFISTSSAGTGNPNRKMRMNYWAAKALYARILMWEGTRQSKEKALEVALEVIGESSLSNGLGTGPGAYYTWVTSAGLGNADWWMNDLAFVNEQLFTLQVERFIEIQKSPNDSRSWFNSSSPNNQYEVVYLTDDRRNLIFESGTPLIDADWRATRSLFADGATLSNWTIAKFYNVPEQSISYSKRMPLMRITEMFYIAAECLLDLGLDRNKAVALLNKVRNQRNIPASLDLNAANLTDNQIRDEITKEYMKEFIAEGQLFYYYKRLGFSTIPGRAEAMTDTEYQMPMPDAEVTNGGLRVN